MCRFEMPFHIDKKGGPTGFVKQKAEGLCMSNSWCGREAVALQCTGDHAHVPLMGGRAAAAQVYPPELCAAICTGLAKQKEYDAKNNVATKPLSKSALLQFVSTHSSVVGQSRNIVGQDLVQKPWGNWPSHWADKFHEIGGGKDDFGSRPQHGQQLLKEAINGLMVHNGVAAAWDDVNDQMLDAAEVKQARKVELEYFEKLGVYTRVP